MLLGLDVQFLKRTLNSNKLDELRRVNFANKLTGTISFLKLTTLGLLFGVIDPWHHNWMNILNGKLTL